MPRHAAPTAPVFPKRRDLRRSRLHSEAESLESASAADRTPVDRTPVDRTAVDRTAVDRTPADRTPDAVSLPPAESAFSPIAVPESAAGAFGDRDCDLLNRELELEVPAPEVASIPLRALSPYEFAPELKPVASVASRFESQASRESHGLLTSQTAQIPQTAQTPPRSQKHTVRRPAAAIAALFGAGSLVLAFALPGVQYYGNLDAAHATAPQQLMNTGAGGDISGSFDALNTVSVEAGDENGIFFNYTDSSVQYPFAESVNLSDPFGERNWPVAGLHDAQDFAAPAGTPIQAIADGEVVEAGYATDGCGFGLKLQHIIDGHDVTSRYCHMLMNSHDLKVGDEVQVGDPVGQVGNTGLSFGAHLHFAITINGEATDPMPFLLKYNRQTRGN